MEGWLRDVIPPELSGAILIALQLEGIWLPELVGMASFLQSQSLNEKLPQSLNLPKSIIDTCRTGGSGTSTFNISTSSRFGSTDVLEALGINPDRVKAAL